MQVNTDYNRNKDSTDGRDDDSEGMVVMIVMGMVVMIVMGMVVMIVMGMVMIVKGWW